MPIRVMENFAKLLLENLASIRHFESNFYAIAGSSMYRAFSPTQTRRSSRNFKAFLCTQNNFFFTESLQVRLLHDVTSLKVFESSSS